MPLKPTIREPEWKEANLMTVAKRPGHRDGSHQDRAFLVFFRLLVTFTLLGAEGRALWQVGY